MEHLSLSVSDFKQLGHDALILPTVEGAGLEVFLTLDFHYLSDCPAFRAVFIQIADEVLLLALQILQTAHKAVLRSVTLAGSASSLAEALKGENRLLGLPYAKMLVVSKDNMIDDFLPDLL